MKEKSSSFAPIFGDRNEINKVAMFAAAIFFAAFLLYVKSISYDLVYFDDDRLILHKKDFNSQLSSIPEAFNETIGGLSIFIVLC